MTGLVRRRALALALAISLAAPPAFACLHGHALGELEPAAPADVAAALAGPPRLAGEALGRKLGELEPRVQRGQATPEEVHDLAVLYARRGQHARALTLLLEVEQQPPPRAATAAALGSLYERGGDLDKAALWLEVAVKRGSADDGAGRRERYHREVVQRKRALRQDPALTDRLNFLLLDFGVGPQPVRVGVLPEEPAALLQQLLALTAEEPEFADLWLVIGELAQLAGEPPATSRLAYQRALALDHPRRAFLAARTADLRSQERAAWLAAHRPVLIAAGAVLLGLMAAAALRFFRALGRRSAEGSPSATA